MSSDVEFTRLFGSRRGVDPSLETPDGSGVVQRIWRHCEMHCVIAGNEDGGHDGWVRLPKAIRTAVGERWWRLRTGMWDPDEPTGCWTLDQLVLAIEREAEKLVSLDSSKQSVEALKVELGLVCPF